MCQDDIKKSMINPLLTFDHIMSISLPDECMVYSSTVYMTLYELFNVIFEDMSLSQLNNVLLKYGITDEVLLKISTNKRKRFKWFCQIMEIIIVDILKIQEKRCHDLKDDQKVKELKSDYRKLLPIIAIDETVLSSEIVNNSLFVDPESSEKLAAIISISIANIVDSLTGVVKGSGGMSSVRYADDVVTEIDSNDNGQIFLKVLEKDKIKINDSLQKRMDRELRSNVNGLDRESGVILNEPMTTIDDEDDLFDLIMYYRVILSKVILMLNDVDKDNYIDKQTIFGPTLERIKVNSKFKDMSRLFNNVKYDINSKCFVSRFLTYLYTWVIKNLDVIADKCYIINNDGPFIELDAKLSYVELVIENLAKLTSSLLTGTSYEEYLLFFNEIQIYLKTNKKNRKKNMRKIDNIYIQKNVLSYNFRRFSGASQDVSMDTLLKLSYLVSVSAPSSKYVVEFLEGYKFKNHDKSQYLIEQLGQAIIEDSRKYGLQKMFKFFILSNPSVYCSTKDQSDGLSVGLLALKFYSFLVNDRRVEKIVQKII